MRQVLSRVVDGVGQTRFLSRVVRAARGDDNAGACGQVGDQEVEEESVADVANGKGLLDALGRGLQGAGELETGV